MNCNMCGKKANKTENLCKDCHSIINVLYYRFTPVQLMSLFSHVLGTKIIQEMTQVMLDSLKSTYNTEEYKDKLH